MHYGQTLYERIQSRNYIYTLQKVSNICIVGG